MSQQSDACIGFRTDVDGANSLWETPPAIFAKLQADFGPFDVDLCANAQNHLLPRWFGPGGEHPDVLTSVLSYGHGFANPVYGNFLAPFYAKMRWNCWEHNWRSTLLVPLRNTEAFRDEVLGAERVGIDPPFGGFQFNAAEILFCSSRICFYEHGEPRWNRKEYNKSLRKLVDSGACGFGEARLPQILQAFRLAEETKQLVTACLNLHPDTEWQAPWIPKLHAVAKKRPDPAPFDSIIVRYIPGHVGPPKVGVWEVPKHV